VVELATGEEGELVASLKGKIGRREAKGAGGLGRGGVGNEDPWLNEGP